MEVRDIVKEAVIIHEDATLKEAVAAMVNRQTNTLLVTDSEGVLTGEVSVADLLDAVIPDTLTGDEIIEHFAAEQQFTAAVEAAADRSVSEFMSVDFTPVTLHDELITIAANAIGFQRARIPVVDSDSRPIGIISRQGLKLILAKTLGLEPKQNTR